MKKTGQKAAVEIDHTKVQRGEPGCHVVTPLKGGQPTCENPPLTLAPPSSTLPAAIAPEETTPTILSRQDQIADYRYDLIAAIEGAISSQKQVRKGTVIDQCLRAYNSGIFLQDIHKKLKHVKRSAFYEWRKALKEGDIKALAPQKGRKGESKITDDEKNCLLGILYSSSKNDRHVKRVGTAIGLMKYAFGVRGIPSPSSGRTLRRFIVQFEKEHSDLKALRLGGEKGLNDWSLPYIPRDRNLLEVGDCLVGDGHRLNFQVINPFTGKPCRPAIVVFLDWRSNYPVGWEIMLEENVQCVASALRNAILALGKIPKCVYLDNGKAFKAKVFNSSENFDEVGFRGMFLRLGIRTIFSQPYNAQAKPIERWFRTFTDWFERLMPSFTGSSIEDKPAYLKRNEKLARSMHDPWIPTIPQVNHLLPEWREFYIDQPSRGLNGKTPREIFEPGKGSGVDPGELAYLMMPMEIKNITRNGIDLFGCYWFDEALYGLRDRVLIKYSLCDLSQIYCFYKNEFLCTLEPRPKAHPLAFELGTPKDVEDVKRMIAQKRSLKSQTVKLYKLLGKKQQDQLPWKEIINEVPNVIEAIEKEEAEKPRAKFISPFPDEPDEKLTLLEEAAPGEETEAQGSAAEDRQFSLSFPQSLRSASAWEIHEWYFVQDPKRFNIADLGWIDWHEDGYPGEDLKSESGQRHLRYLLSKRPGEAEYEPENEEDGRDYRLGHDPAVEQRWREIKNGITIDPISVLSSPAGGLPGDDEELRHRFYRGIENRFPGTLTDSDWEEVKRYQGTRDWERMHHEYEIPRLTRPLDQWADDR